MLKGHEIEDSARPNADSTETACVVDLSSKTPVSAPAPTSPVVGGRAGGHPTNDPDIVSAAGDLELRAAAPEPPELVFRYLAPKLAARQSMRLIDPRTNKGGKARRLTNRPPTWPAAVPTTDRTGRSNIIPFDFDANRGGPDAVTRDAARLKAWLAECGGVWISDHNPGNGGRHVLALLHESEWFRKVNIEPVARLLAARLPTLDLSPVLSSHAITPPGSSTKSGTPRMLEGTLAEALKALERRSAPGLLARLRTLLGDTLSNRSSTLREQACNGIASEGEALDELPPELWEGFGAAARLRPGWQLSTPIPATPLAFAESGALPADGRYLSRSEARQSVLYHSALRGFSLEDVIARTTETAAHPWRGLTSAYARYGASADIQLQRDWSKACRFASQNVSILLSPGHREHKGRTPPVGDEEKFRHRTVDSPYSRWLAQATAWVNLTWPGQAYRWTVLAVLQAMAYAAFVAGDLGIDGTPLVEVGVRALSLFAGLMPFTTLADVLADIRERPGSPILRVRQAAGTLADRYSLVTAHYGDDLEVAVEPVPLERVQVAQVHDAWRVLGLHKRVVFELITHVGLTRPADIFAAARIAERTGYTILGELLRDGLIVRAGRGAVAPGPTGLDEIALKHGLPEERSQRLDDIKRQRREWRKWLEIRHQMVPDPNADSQPVPQAPWDLDDELDAAIWAAQLETGPPEDQGPHPEDIDVGDERDADAVALALLREQLGAVLL